VTEGDVESSAFAIEQARQGSSLPVLVGGRTVPDTVAKALAIADGVIVGSCLRHDGRTSGDLDGARVSDYMSAARAAGYPAISRPPA
jgi:predicted TIM-barrel enzyme